MLYCLLFVVLIFTVISFWMTQKQAKGVVLILITSCFVLSFIRWETGTDWDTYYNIFLESKDLSNYTPVERTFFLLNHLCYTVSESYTFCLFIEAAILFTCSYGILSRQPLPMFSYFLLFASTLGNVMFVRQSIAVAIILYSYKYILNQEPRKFYICVTCAILIHTSSLIALPLYFLFHKQIKWRVVILALGVLFLFALCSPGNIIRSMVGGNSFIAAKIVSYLNRSASGADLDYIVISPQKAVLMHLIKRAFVLALIILYCRKRIGTDKTLAGYLRIYLYSSGLYFIVTPLSMDLSRLCTPIELVDIFLYPYILYQLRTESAQYITIALIIILGLSKFMSNYNRFPEIFGSYKTIFS